jgi:hypothetical protein
MSPELQAAVEKVARLACGNFYRKCHPNMAAEIRSALVEEVWTEWKGEALAAIRAVAEATKAVTESMIVAAHGACEYENGLTDNDIRASIRAAHAASILGEARA